MDPDIIKLFKPFMQWPGPSSIQNFEIGWLCCQSALGKLRNGETYHWKMMSNETPTVYIRTMVLMMIRMSMSSAIGNMRR